MKCLVCIFVILQVSRAVLPTNIDGEGASSSVPVSSNTLGATVTISSSYLDHSFLNQSAPSNEINPLDYCPSNVECKLLEGDCITCTFNTSCVYGSVQQAECTHKKEINCTGDKVFKRNYECRYCYQLPDSWYRCNQSITCMISQARQYYPSRSTFTSLCTTNQERLCLGRRRFYKELLCNWTSGYKWTTAFILSITLGGFGVDRFYLGLWREGIGKLFSFGGLGVWTLVDVILVGVGYIGPADGSIYI